MSKRLPLLGVVFLIIGLVVGVYYVNQKRGFELRKKAAETKGSQILLKGPSRVNVGEKFSVGVILDTTTDSQYTISGVDAVVSYGLQGIAGSGKTSSVPLAGTVVVKPETNPTGMSEEEIRRREQDLQGTKLGSSPGRPDFLPPQTIYLLSVTPGKIFDSYPTIPKGSELLPCGGFAGVKCPAGYICQLPPNPPGSVVNDAQGYCVPDRPVVYGSAGGTATTGTTVNMQERADQAPNSSVCPPFPGCPPPGTGNTMGMPWNTCWGDAAVKCPLWPGNTVTISGVKNYSVNDKGYFKGFTGQGVFATLNFVAQSPGKATIGLVYKGPSATDDTNINGFLARQPVSLQKPQERLLTAPQTFTVEVVASQKTPTPTPSCVQPPPGCVDKSGNFTLCDPRPGVTWCRPTPTPKPSCTPLPPCAYEGVPDPNDSSKRVFCVIDLLPGAWSCPRPTPTPTPPPVGKLSFTLSDTNGNPVRQVVKIFAVPAPTNVRGATAYAAGFSELIVSNTPSPNTPPPPNRDSLVLLGETQTNAGGAGDIWIKNEYLSKPWALYAQTPSHLIRYMQVNIYPVWFSPGKTVDVKFDNLIPGDIYVASGQNRQDGVINNFDVADLFRQWGPYAQIQINSPKPPVPADLNADGTVNNRDLAVLLSNFGKKGDLQQATSTGKEGNFTGVLKPAGPSIYMWGTHTLEVDDGTVYRVRTISGAKELLTRYEGQRVIVSGTLEYLQLEGGFWSLTAEGVVVDEGPGFGPNPAQ